MVTFRPTIVALARLGQRLSSQLLHKWHLRQQGVDLQRTFGSQAAAIAQEVGADYAQAGALSDAVFWLQLARRLGKS